MSPRTNRGRLAVLQLILRTTVPAWPSDNLSCLPCRVLFRRATYRDIPGFTPLIERAGILGAPDTQSTQPAPTFDALGWYPAFPVSLRQFERTQGTGTVLFGRDEARLLFYVEQYHAGQGTERLFEEIVLDEYYSASEDRNAPIIQSVKAQPAGRSIALQVKAGDPSGVNRVVVAYTDNPSTGSGQRQGSWDSVDLTRDIASGAWQEVIPVGDDMPFFVQVVDGAGNVAIVDTDGQ